MRADYLCAETITSRKLLGAAARSVNGGREKRTANWSNQARVNTNARATERFRFTRSVRVIVARVVVVVAGVIVAGVVLGNGFVDLVHVEGAYLFDEAVERLGRERAG